MQSSLRILLAFGCLVVLCLNSGCSAIIAAQLSGKLPVTSADELSVSVNVVGAGGGSIAVTGAKKNADGTLTATSYHEEINTGAGSLKIDGKNVTLPAPK